MRAAPADTPRLAFRPIRLGDEILVFPEVDEVLTAHWIGWEPPRSEEEMRQEIARSLDEATRATRVEFLAFGKDDGAFVGVCHLVPYPEHPGELDIGVWVRRAAQGKGYATEMVGALVAWAGEYLDVPYLVYSVTEGNGASAAIVARMGAPVLREYVADKRGEWRRVTDYRIALDAP